MKHPWRCMACAEEGNVENHYGLNFEAETPKCPKCGAEPPVVIELVRVHFVHMDPKGLLRGHHSKPQSIACAPHVRAFNANIRATGQPSAVTCPECKASAQFKEEIVAERATFGGVVLSPSSQPLAQQQTKE